MTTSKRPALPAGRPAAPALVTRPLASRISRRRVLASGAAMAAAGLAAPGILRAQDRVLKIGSYGGYFENSFKEHVYPAFTEATGIAVESMTQPNSADWLLTMQNAASAGTVPADISLYGRDTLLKAVRIGGLVAPIDLAKVPSAGNLDPYFVYESEGTAFGVGAMSWFVSMVVNPNVVEVPTSWTAFWETETYEASLGISKEYNSNFMDVVAATFFDGPEILSTTDGIATVIEKTAELKANVALWWDAESQMEQAFKNEDVIGGMYYHDVAGLMAADGFPIVSVFPEEGNPQSYGSWCLSEGSENADLAHAFLTFSSDPATQAIMSRKIGTAPLVSKEAAGLTDEEFDAVSGTPSIRPNFEAYLDHETYMKDAWDTMLAAS
ncbi:MAG: extracellular solute-binding protein [Pseudomonadota bacterium]